MTESIKMTLPNQNVRMSKSKRAVIQVKILSKPAENHIISGRKTKYCQLILLEA